MVDAAIEATLALNKSAEIVLPKIAESIDLHLQPNRAEYRWTPDYRSFAQQPARAKLASLLNGPFQDHRFWRVSNIDTIFDVSGFYIGGGHDFERAQRIVEHYRAGVSRGAKLIVLPKTFGPFRDHRERALVKELVALSSAFFCRDEISRGSVLEIAGEKYSERVKLGFDYTASVPGAHPSAQVPSRAAAIIPNIRMIDRTEQTVSKTFLQFMADLTNVARDKGLTPIIVLQQPDIDKRAAAEILALAEPGIEVFSSHDHREVKGFISRCEVVFSARFHGILNAISSAVPVIGLGWNHKYIEMMKSFDMERFFIDGERMLGLKGDGKEISNLIDDALRSKAEFSAAKVQHVGLAAQLWGDLSPLINPA